MTDNDDKLLSPYNAEELLKSLIKKINKRTEFTEAAGMPVTETQIVRIEYGLVAEMGQYLEDLWVWRSVDKKSWAAFQEHFIEFQEDLLEHQQTALQGSYGYNNLARIEDEFDNQIQETLDERASVTNLTDAKVTLTSQCHTPYVFIRYST